MPAGVGKVREAAFEVSGLASPEGHQVALEGIVTETPLVAFGEVIAGILDASKSSDVSDS